MLAANEDTFSLFAPGKLFVFGEWSVLEGAPAMVVEVPAGQKGALCLSKGSSSPSFTYRAPDLTSEARCWRWSSGQWKIERGESPAFDLVGATLQESAGVFGPPQHNLELEVRPENLFVERYGKQRKLGFGSSGAVCALVAKALGFAAQSEPSASDPMPPERVFPVAHHGHRRAQNGKGSGADVAVSVYGGLLCYRLNVPPGLSASVDDPEPGVDRIAGRDDLEMMAVWTGQEADTRVLMAAMRKFEQRDRQEYGIAIRVVGDAAAAGVAAWRHGRADDVLEAVRMSHASLVALEQAAGICLVTDAQRTIAKQVEAIAGNQAAIKLSGAGGGDMVLVVAHQNTDLRSELCNSGYIVVPIPLNP